MITWLDLLTINELMNDSEREIVRKRWADGYGSLGEREKRIYYKVTRSLESERTDLPPEHRIVLKPSYSNVLAFLHSEANELLSVVEATQTPTVNVYHIRFEGERCLPEQNEMDRTQFVNWLGQLNQQGKKYEITRAW